jgi:hypothetical protein
MVYTRVEKRERMKRRKGEKERDREIVVDRKR